MGLQWSAGLSRERDLAALSPSALPCSVDVAGSGHGPVCPSHRTPGGAAPSPLTVDVVTPRHLRHMGEPGTSIQEAMAASGSASATNSNRPTDARRGRTDGRQDPHQHHATANRRPGKVSYANTPGAKRTAEMSPDQQRPDSRRDAAANRKPPWQVGDREAGRRSIPEGGYSPCLTCAISPASFSAVPFTSYFAAF